MRNPQSDRPTCLHATCVDISGHGVLLLGNSGSGKSDLALRLIDQGGNGTGESGLPVRLVADDQVILRADAQSLMARAPAEIAGRLEVRGAGIIAVPHTDEVAVRLAVELAGRDQEIERVPDFTTQRRRWQGVSIPLVRLRAFEASAPAKIRATLVAVVHSGFANHFHTVQDGADEET